MEQARKQTREFTPEPEVDYLVPTPKLKTDAEAARLLCCVNEVRAGNKVYFVRVTNKKVSKSPRRMPGTDYHPDPGLAPNAHEGWMVRASTNQKGGIYLHILDRARAGVNTGDELQDLTWAEIEETMEADKGLPKAERKWDHTRINLGGLLSFRVLGEQDRYPQQPLQEQQAQEDQEDQEEQQARLAEALIVQSRAQALLAESQILLTQAVVKPPRQPPRP